jgi:conserved repeat domain
MEQIDNSNIIAEQNTIHIQNGNEKETKNEMPSITSNIEVQTKEEKSNNQKVEGKWELLNSSPKSQYTLWENNYENEFTNTAVMEEKALEELVYAESAGNREGNERIFEEEIYKKNSETVYHRVNMPIISFEKSSSLENNRITYYMHLENVGKVVAYNTIVKDLIPEYTEFVQIVEKPKSVNSIVTAEYKEQMETIFWTISQIEVGEVITVAFQVKVNEEEYLENREIRNIAYMKVTGNRETEEADYCGSNEIIYKMQWQENEQPKTGDKESNITLLFILMLVSIYLISIYMKSRRMFSKNKRDI